MTLKTGVILKRNRISQITSFYSMFDQITAALVNMRDANNLTDPKLLINSPRVLGIRPKVVKV